MLLRTVATRVCACAPRAHFPPFFSRVSRALSHVGTIENRPRFEENDWNRLTNATRLRLSIYANVRCEKRENKSFPSSSGESNRIRHFSTGHGKVCEILVESPKILVTKLLWLLVFLFFFSLWKQERWKIFNDIIESSRKETLFRK